MIMADTPNTPEFTRPEIFQARAKLFKWVMNGVSTGAAIRAADYPDINVQAYDPAGGGWGSATLVWEGTLDPLGVEGWGTITDTTETPLSQNDDTPPTQVLQGLCVWIRPKTTGGTDTTIHAFANAGKSN